MDILTITITEDGLVYLDGTDGEMEHSTILAMRLDPIEVVVRDYRKKSWWRRG